MRPPPTAPRLAFLSLVAPLWLVATRPASAQEPTAEPLQEAWRQRPNVLIVVGDDLSERDIDRIDTPTFDSLVERGLRFRRAYSNPTCSLSRWSLHFGQYQVSDAGPVCNGYAAETAPSTDQASLPRLFRGAGYRTALFGKWHLGSHPGVEDGEPWEITPTLHGYETWRAGIPINVASCGGMHYKQWLRVDDGHSAMSTEYTADAIRDAFLGWHAEMEDQSAPWFAMVCFQVPHAPFHIAPDVPAEVWKKGMSTRDHYESLVRYMDTKLGELLAPVDLARTQVIFMADNGTPPLAASKQQSKRKLKTTTFEGGIGVPLVWTGRGVPAGVQTQALTHLSDFLPTFADLLGVELEPDGLDGVSLQPVLQDPQTSARDYVWTGLAPRSDYAVITRRYKLRRVPTGEQLIDLKVDRGENRNLMANDFGRRHLADLIERLQEKLQRHLPSPSSPSSDGDG